MSLVSVVYLCMCSRSVTQISNFFHTGMLIFSVLTYFVICLNICAGRICVGCAGFWAVPSRRAGRTPPRQERTRTISGQISADQLLPTSHPPPQISAPAFWIHNYLVQIRNKYLSYLKCFGCTSCLYFFLFLSSAAPILGHFFFFHLFVCEKIFLLQSHASYFNT